MKTGIRSFAAAAVLALTLAACGGDGDDGTEAADDTTTTESGDGTTTEPDTSTTEELSPEDRVWADLTAAMDVVVEVSAAPDPESPDLERHFTGESLSGIQDSIRDLQAGGAGATVTMSPHRYSVNVGGELATVDYCYTSETVYLDTAGNPAGTENTSMRGTAQMELIDDIWKIAEQEFTQEECPAS